MPLWPVALAAVLFFAFAVVAYVLIVGACPTYVDEERRVSVYDQDADDAA